MNINSWKIGPFPQILWLPQNCVCEITSLQHNDVFDIQKSFGIYQENIRDGQQIRRLEKPKKENREINKKGNYWNMNMHKKEEQENLEKTIELILRIIIKNWKQKWKWNQKLDLDKKKKKRKEKKKRA